MPSITTSIQPIGPVIQLAAMVSAPRRAALLARGLPLPTPVIFSGLIDTGATSTCVDNCVISQLGVPPSGAINIFTPSSGTTPQTRYQFDLDLALLMDGDEVHFIQTLPVIATVLQGHGFQALIGRDVLSQATFLYNGKKSELTLTF